MKKVMSAFIGMGMLLALTTSGCKDNVQYVHVGPNWDRVHNLQPSENSFDVIVNGNEELKVGDTMTFSVSSAEDGRLWVLEVDPSDKVTALFPSTYEQDNSIEANQFFPFPPKDAGYELVAGEPLGRSTLAFIVTKGDTQLGEALKKGELASKALALQTVDPQWGIGRIVVNVTK